MQPRRFFRLLWDRAISTGLGSVMIVEASARPVAAAVFLAWHGTASDKFGASCSSAWLVAPDPLCFFWNAVRTAGEQM